MKVLNHKFALALPWRKHMPRSTGLLSTLLLSSPLQLSARRTLRNTAQETSNNPQAPINPRQCALVAESEALKPDIVALDQQSLKNRARPPIDTHPTVARVCGPEVECRHTWQQPAAIKTLGTKTAVRFIITAFPHTDLASNEQYLVDLKPGENVKVIVAIKQTARVRHELSDRMMCPPPVQSFMAAHLDPRIVVNCWPLPMSHGTDRASRRAAALSKLLFRSFDCEIGAPLPAPWWCNTLIEAGL
jgi:hypothetical protein